MHTTVVYYPCLVVVARRNTDRMLRTLLELQQMGSNTSGQLYTCQAVDGMSPTDRMESLRAAHWYEKLVLLDDSGDSVGALCSDMLLSPEKIR